MRHHLILFFCALILFAPTPFAAPLMMDDIAHHLIWGTLFSEQFWSGDFYPRWLDGMEAGLGSPAFYFYSPLPYWIGALSYPLLPASLQEWAVPFVSAFIAFWCSGIAFYYFGRQLFAPGAALLAAILYMGMPYPLWVDLYYRFAVAELWAFVWVPLLLFLVRRMVEQLCWRHVALYSLCFAALILSHAPSALLCAGLPLVYAAYYGMKLKQFAPFTATIIASVAGAGLAAFYLSTALFAQEFASLDILYITKYHFSQNFLFKPEIFTPEGFHSDNRNVLLLSLLSLLFIGLSLVALQVVREGKHVANRRESWFWFVMVWLSLFMASYPALIVWDAIPLLQKVQFPWRLHLLVSIGISVLLVLRLFPTLYRFQKSALAYVLILPILCMAGIAGMIAMSYQGFMVIPDPKARTYLDYHIQPTWEYHPRWASYDFFTLEGLEAIGQSDHAPIVVKGEADVSITEWKPEQKRIAVHAMTDSTIQLQHFYWPHWRLEDQDGSAIDIEPAPFNGFIQFTLPAGSYDLVLSKRLLPVERIGILITGASAALLALWGLASRLRLRRRRGLGRNKDHIKRKRIS